MKLMTMALFIPQECLSQGFSEIWLKVGLSGLE